MSTTETGEEPLWDTVAAAWDRWSPVIHGWFDPATERLLDMVGMKAGDRVLDLAAGNGDQTFNFLRRIGPTGHVVATDVSSDGLRFAKRNFEKNGAHNVTTLEMNAEEITFPDESFDVVMSRAGLPYFSNQEKSVKEIVRVLKPGGGIGILGFTTMAKNDFFAMPISIIRKHCGLPPMKDGDVGPFSLSVPGALEQLFSKCGLRDIRIEAFDSPLKNKSSAEHLRCLRESWPILHNYMAPLNDEQKAACWAEIGTAMQKYDTPDGFAFPSELLLGVARK